MRPCTHVFQGNLIMTNQAHPSSSTASVDNDIGNLFSHFGKQAEGMRYQEVVSEQAARHAICRWPLLAEIAGIALPPPAPAEQS
jgi:hypothetical protein